MPSLVSVIVSIAVIACAVTEVLGFCLVPPPDALGLIMGGLWLAMPYVIAVMLARSFRRNRTPLIVLAVSLLLAAFVGTTFTYSSVSQQVQREKEVQTAVQPGEDPHAGPAAMRKNGAEMGEFIGWGVLILFGVVIPPLQVGMIVVPAVIAWAATRKRANEPAD